MSGQELATVRQQGGDLAAQAAATMSALAKPRRTYNKMQPLLHWAVNGAQRAPLDPKRAVEHRDKARHWLEKLPDNATIVDVAMEFHSVAVDQATDDQCRIVLAFLIDCYPQAGRLPAVGTYVEGMRLILNEDPDYGMPSANALAIAVQRLLARSKFLPSVSEVLAEANLVTRRFWGAYCDARHLQELRNSAEDVLFELGEWSPPDDGFDDTIPARSS